MYGPGSYTGLGLLFALLSLILPFIVFYYIIKAAVKNGTIAAWEEIEQRKSRREHPSD